MTKKNTTKKDVSIDVIANRIESLMNQSNDLKYKNDLFFRDEINIRGTYEIAELIVCIDMSSVREDGTKDGQAFKDEMKANNLAFLTLRENRTALNGLRRLKFKDVKCTELQDFTVDDTIAMVKHEKFIKSKMANFQTVVNNTKKYWNIADKTSKKYLEIIDGSEKALDKNKSSSNGSSSNEDNSNVDTFENFYNKLEKVLKDKSTDFEKVLTIQELVNNVVEERRNDLKLSKAS